MLRRVAWAVALAAAAGGCGSEDEEGLPAACRVDPEKVVAALRPAPERVTLAGGTRLSDCVRGARSDADLQTLGVAFTRAAERLAVTAPRRDADAVRLGYLVGAARRGAGDTGGIHLELVHRLESAASLDGAPPARQDALRRGLAAGADHG